MNAIRAIGRYQIVEELGKGAMAVVYKAYDPNIDRTLAIKVLRLERCIDSEYRVRFLREAKAAGNLSHPNIVTIYDVGEVDNRPYIVMELLEGKPLDHIMKEGKQFSVTETLNIAIQLASALDYAHQYGIVHRDIKPSNIVFSENGSIKITDFGIAHVESSDTTQQTQMGEVLGTPQYMSPEQVLGQKVDGRSDLFSVGVILYQLLSNQRPFKGDTVATLMFQIATEEPPPLAKVAPTVPEPLRLIVEKLLKKQPERRFQSGRELADALKRMYRDLEEQTRRASEPRVIPLRIKWAAIMSAIVALTMVVSVTVVYNKQFAAMQQQTVEQGMSLVNFIATENAESVLSEDWTVVELFVNEVIARQNFIYLSIVDYKDVVRGDSRPERIGKPHVPTGTGEVLAENKGTKVTSMALEGAGDVFEFSTPILFQTKEIGRVYVALSQDSLKSVANLTLTMMFLLMAVTLAAVVVVAFLFGSVLDVPLKLLRNSMDDIAAGRVHSRITQTRKDEFGQLYNAFNKMANAIQQRDEGHSSER
jgi:serine/threonine-protein kinase